MPIGSLAIAPYEDAAAATTDEERWRRMLGSHAPSVKPIVPVAQPVPKDQKRSDEKLEQKLLKALQKSFDSMDFDHNGMITRDEQKEFYRISGMDLSDEKVLAQMDAQWAKVDVNKDGCVSREEFKRAQLPLMRKAYEAKHNKKQRQQQLSQDKPKRKRMQILLSARFSRSRQKAAAPSKVKAVNRLGQPPAVKLSVAQALPLPQPAAHRWGGYAPASLELGSQQPFEFSNSESALIRQLRREERFHDEERVLEEGEERWQFGVRLMRKIMRIWAMTSRGAASGSVKDWHWEKIKQQCQDRDSMEQAWQALAEKRFLNWLDDLASKRKQVGQDEPPFTISRVGGPELPMTFVRPRDRLIAHASAHDNTHASTPVTFTAPGEYMEGVTEEHIFTFIISYLRGRKRVLAEYRAAHVVLSPLASMMAQHMARQEMIATDDRDADSGQSSPTKSHSGASSPTGHGHGGGLPPLHGPGVQTAHAAQLQVEDDELEALPDFQKCCQAMTIYPKLLKPVTPPRPSPIERQVVENDRATQSAVRHQKILEEHLTSQLSRLWEDRCARREEKEKRDREMEARRRGEALEEEKKPGEGDDEEEEEDPDALPAVEGDDEHSETSEGSGGDGAGKKEDGKAGEGKDADDGDAKDAEGEGEEGEEEDEEDEYMGPMDDYTRERLAREGKSFPLLLKTTPITAAGRTVKRAQRQGWCFSPWSREAIGHTHEEAQAVEEQARWAQRNPGLKNAKEEAQKQRKGAEEGGAPVPLPPSESPLTADWTRTAHAAAAEFVAAAHGRASLGAAQALERNLFLVEMAREAQKKREDAPHHQLQLPKWGAKRKARQLMEKEARCAAGAAEAAALLAAVAASAGAATAMAVTAAARTRLQWTRLAMAEVWSFDPWTGQRLQLDQMETTKGTETGTGKGKGKGDDAGEEPVKMTAEMWEAEAIKEEAAEEGRVLRRVSVSTSLSVQQLVMRRPRMPGEKGAKVGGGSKDELSAEELANLVLSAEHALL